MTGETVTADLDLALAANFDAQRVLETLATRQLSAIEQIAVAGTLRRLREADHVLHGLLRRALGVKEPTT